GFRYGASSLLPEDQPRPVARDAPGDRSLYLQLPEGFSSRIGELAERVGASAASPLGKAVALETHLRSAYAYSFETVFTSQGVTPLEAFLRSEEHTSELQSRFDLVCRLLLEKKKKT